MYKSVLASTILFIFFTLSCAPTETLSDTDSDSEAEVVAETSPEWFNPQIESTFESGQFTGYSHAIASNRSDAERLAKQAAMVNLRFEIDSYVEEVRVDLAENQNESRYGSSRFIINLRNAVQNMNLDGAEAETEFYDESGIINSYSRLVISLDDAKELLARSINDNDFVNAMQPTVQ